MSRAKVSEISKNEYTSMLNDIASTIYFSTSLKALIVNSKTLETEYVHDSHNNLVNVILEDIISSIVDMNGKLTDEPTIINIGYDFMFIAYELDRKCFKNKVLLFGPFLINHVTKESIQYNLNKVTTEEKKVALQSLYLSSPYMNETKLHYSKKIIGLFLSTQKLNAIFCDDKIYNITPHQLHLFSDKSTLRLIDLKIEEEFLEALTNAELTTALSIYNSKIKKRFIIPASNNPLRTSKNMAISLTSIIVRKVSVEKVEPTIALGLEKKYEGLIESASDLMEISRIMEKLVTDVISIIIRASGIEHINILEKAKEFINMNISKQIRLVDVAKYVDLTPNYFSSIFKKEMKISFTEYINEKRIKESKRLLEYTDYTILQISNAVGFKNQNYFTTIFRKVTGSTPKQYRMKL